METRGAKRRQIDSNPELKKQKEKQEADEKEEKRRRKMTLGDCLAEDREKEREELEKAAPELQEFEPFKTYSIDQIKKKLGKTSPALPNIAKLNDVYLKTDNGVYVLFLEVKNAPHPATFSHICNNSSLKWNLTEYSIAYNDWDLQQHANHTNDMVFVETKARDGVKQYIYAGLMGRQGMMSSGGVYIESNYLFEPKLNKKEMESFGNLIVKCKKNKYGSSLCAK